MTGLPRSVPTLHPGSDPVPLGRVPLGDIDTLRLMLRGSSVVDWTHLHFKKKEDAEAFIRVNELDPSDVKDRARLESLHRRAVHYLREHLRYRVPELVAEPRNVLDLFDYASGRGRRVHRFYACLTLKVMHILNHVDAEELLVMLPVSTEEIAVLMQAKIERVVRGLVERRFPIVEFSGNAKSSYSIISKLLAKKETQAARLFDKLRFRFVTERREDIVAVMIALSRELCPFNYLVPNQSENSLVDVDRTLVRAGNLSAIKVGQEAGRELNESEGSDYIKRPGNELSGPDYRAVNFVADVPLRIDRVLSLEGRQRLDRLGPVVFAMVEFQLVDRATETTNESGPNRHAAYKLRQRKKVRERLERGKRPKGRERSEED